ncbi:MAG: tRNA lysidine(34) synthetase TilS [Alphaproteobacteria bacterium]|nr:tRNA lysidine(34) synthetase TilS [Alphaproteobacteria bacterium]
MPHALGLAIEAEEFARLLAPFAPLSDKIALAVSGGADSMALAICVKRWAQRESIALIVEHGLRPESAAEAVEVKARLEGIGLKAEILPWRHEDLLARVEEKARRARYALLCEACCRLGAGDLLLAHHSGDQAETILMRLSKGSGIDGLAGMAAQTSRDGVRMLRPFLSLPKERLVATCATAGIDYVSDPTNHSPKYARGRLRGILPLLAAEGMTVANLAALGAKAREAKEALDYYARAFLQTAAKAEIGGSVRLDLPALHTVPRATALRALSACLRYVHDGDYPPEPSALQALLDWMTDRGARDAGIPFPAPWGERGDVESYRHISNSPPHPNPLPPRGGRGDCAGVFRKNSARTFYGCILSLGENHATILREPAAVSEVVPSPSGATVLWDKRWLVTARESATNLTIRALGFPPHTAIASLAPDLRRQIPQGRIRASLPALWKGNKLYAIPSFDPQAAFGLAYRKQGIL